jgi:quercetin dioxygenase-like cupin family protein
VKIYHPGAIAATAVAAAPERPAVTIAHDHEHGRLVVFRIDPGQQVAVHTSVSSVFLTIMSGAGFVSGAEGEHAVEAGAVAAFAPHEPHGMRAGEAQLVIAALIAPRPGGA